VGFHPEESIVAVFIRSGRVVLAARIDLPPESAADEVAAQIEYLPTVTRLRRWPWSPIARRRCQLIGC
jgi:hypothetical protein